MDACETCGNTYDKAFTVTTAGVTHTFDCFECAVHALAPRCDSCGVVIIGHGLEEAGEFFCSAHCARKQGTTRLRDRVRVGAQA